MEMPSPDQAVASRGTRLTGHYDAIVIGSGPNGLAAAITLQRAGVSTLLLEGKDTIGGGARTAQLTVPGFVHDVCAAVHPMALLSPFFKELPLSRYGLEWVFPEVVAAHPLEGDRAGALYHSLEETAASLGNDEKAYRRLMEPVVSDLPVILPQLLSPFPGWRHPAALAAFGLKALSAASQLVKRFESPEARALWGGMAAHSMQPLEHPMTAAIGLMLMAAGHLAGWPLAKGGSQSVVNALAACFQELGGTIQTGFSVKKLSELPKTRAMLFDVTPRQLLEITGDRLPTGYRKRLGRYRYGMGVFKVDWALSEPIPFRAAVCRKAGTVHLGNTYEETAASERATAAGKIPARPFVLLSQPSIFDPSRAPEGKHTAWAYCHVPHGAGADMTGAIEEQVERFAPGFRETIIRRHTLSAVEMEAYNPNYVGGDINGGVQDLFQHFSRPVLSISPYRTPAKGIYLCSSATPPGGGVHGMCGFHAASRALKDIFS